jgi:hypothetical protein
MAKNPRQAAQAAIEQRIKARKAKAAQVEAPKADAPKAAPKKKAAKAPEPIVVLTTADLAPAATAVESPAPAKAPKKAAKAKPAEAPATDAAAKPAAEYGVERSKDLPWNEKKVAVFKALRNPKLNGGEGTAKEVAELGTNLTPRDVRHYCYHAKAAGLVKVENVDGNKYHFSLTAKGKAIDPDTALAEQLASKAKAPKAAAAQ